MAENDDEIYAIHVTNESNNSAWLKYKLSKLWGSPKFCGVCLESNDNLCSVEMEFSIGQHSATKSLLDMISYVFNDDIENIMASSQICEVCAEKTIQSYLFITKTRQLSKIMHSCVSDIYSKVVDINDQLDVSENYNNANVMIVLETDTEVNSYIENITASVTEIIPKNGDSSKGNQYDTLDAFKKIIKDQKLPDLKDIPKSTLPSVPLRPENIVLPKPKLMLRENSTRERKVTKPEGTPNISLKEGKIIIKPLSSVRNTNIAPGYNTYNCSLCSEIFTSHKMLKEHEKLKHKTTVYRCKLCDKTYNTQQYLNVHYKTHCKVRCKLCQIILPDEELNDHLRKYHENLVHPCKFCNLVYYSPDSLETHFKITHLVNDVKSKLECVMCLRTFKDEEYRTHRCKFFCPECTVMPCIHHKFLMTYRDQVLNQVTKVKCPDCDYATRRKEYLISHANREHLGHHPFTCDDCGQQFYTKMSLKTHIMQFHQDLNICEFCDFVFKTSSRLATHRKACRLIIRPFNCEHCNASFDTAEELTKHETLRHSEGVYPCSLCKREFLTPLKLEEHHVKVHSGIQCKKRRRNIECTLCVKKFKNLKEMMQHEKLHDPNVKFPCNVCSKEFDNLKKLYMHKQRHYSAKVQCDGCKKMVTTTCYVQHAVRCPYKRNLPLTHICETCGKAFHLESMLKFHLKIHMKPVPCPQCGKRIKPAYLKKHLDQVHGSMKADMNKPAITCEFCDYAGRKKSDLEAHVNRYHLKIKPYVCNVCNKAFCGKARLTDHLSTHTSFNTCFCSVCGKKFANRVCLKMHFRMHTGEAPYECDICGEKFRSSSIMKTHRLKKHLEKTVACPLCDSMFYIIRDMRHHFKNIHWKHKDRPFNPREVKELDESYYYMFEDGRLPRFDEDVGYNAISKDTKPLFSTNSMSDEVS